MTDSDAVIHRLRTGKGQCEATCWFPIEGDAVTLDQCLDAVGHDGDHQGLFGNWSRPTATDSPF